MRIKITRSTFVKGTHVEAGDTADVDPDTANQLLSMGKAIAQPEPEAEPEAEPAAEPEAEVAPKQKRGRSKKD